MKKKTEHTEHTKSMKVEEPMIAYGVATYSPLHLIVDEFVPNLSDFDLVAAARKGIAKRNVLSLAKKLSLTIAEMADILHINERTLQRYAPDTLIKTEHADRVIELARLYERGMEVLGSAEAFDSWLRHPNYALKSQAPLTLLDTSIGFTMVLDLLGRIEQGVFS